MAKTKVPYDAFDNNQINQILLTVLADKPFEQCPIQGEDARKWYDALKEDIDNHPGAIVEMAETEDFNDTDKKVMQAISDGLKDVKI